MAELCTLDLLWIPVGAGTSRLQRASLVAWEAFEAFRARRSRMDLYHSALKLTRAGTAYTLELMPAFVATVSEPLATGPVGFGFAARFRLFRYQFVLQETESLPDESWAVGEPARLTESCETVDAVLAAADKVPRHVWGRRVRGTQEMWTSDSAISWALTASGLDLSESGPPAGGRAPGWHAGIAVARLDSPPV